MDSNCRFRSETNSRINAARKAIGDSGEEQKLIRTIARRGFRFIGAVRTQSNGDGPADAVVSPRDELRAQSRPAVPLSDRPAIAVLPFVNMSGDPEEEYFSDGITEDIITALSKLRWFFVIVRNSSFIYKGIAVHMKQVAQELGVGYVVRAACARAATACASRSSSMTPPPGAISGVGRSVLAGSERLLH